ncbi:MAG TPA: hypothetical protein VLX58_14420 [Bryobacteraceae bacterium]|nr:hypothetical protein [Bryobacteraceae bacterium]
MKKLMTAALALSFLTGVASMSFAQEKKDDTTTGKKAKKTKKSKKTKKEETK